MRVNETLLCLQDTLVSFNVQMLWRSRGSDPTRRTSPHWCPGLFTRRVKAAWRGLISPSPLCVSHKRWWPLHVLLPTVSAACHPNTIISACRVRPVGSTSESDTEFDRMKQVCLHSFHNILTESFSTVWTWDIVSSRRKSWTRSYASCIGWKTKSSMVSLRGAFLLVLLRVTKPITWLALSRCSHQTRNWPNRHILIPCERQRAESERRSGWRIFMQMHRQEDPGNVLSMFLWTCNATCRDVVPTFESAGQREKWT